MADPRRTCQHHLRVKRMLVQPNKTPFQHRNAQPRHPRDPPHQVRPRSLTPHRRCPCYGESIRCSPWPGPDGLRCSIVTLVLLEWSPLRVSGSSHLLLV
jgi:hypothetical protein